MDVARANDFDIIFIFREALMTGSMKFERQFHNSRAKVVFDFDDAIWHLNVSDANRMFGWLKKPRKTGKIIGLSDIVLAGNNYLAEYARKFNNNVKIIPTTIDTDAYKPVGTKQDTGKIVIGWSGSMTTIKHFELALPFLKILQEKYGDRLVMKVIGDAHYANAALGIQGMPWNRDTETEDLSSFDIGIMPLPDDEWARGKCGLKGLQYMALGIPPLMSPVGVNAQIVQHGSNGFLPKTTEEWVQYIEKLIASPGLRNTMGQAARKTVEKKYSVNAWKGKYLELLSELVK
jgi:glycosyltransferase involved in cell wall biosynthesis